jgi:hypothetical protein
MITSINKLEENQPICIDENYEIVKLQTKHRISSILSVERKIFGLSTDKRTLYEWSPRDSNLYTDTSPTLSPSNKANLYNYYTRLYLLNPSYSDNTTFCSTDSLSSYAAFIFTTGSSDMHPSQNSLFMEPIKISQARLKQKRKLHTLTPDSHSKARTPRRLQLRMNEMNKLQYRMMNNATVKDVKASQNDYNTHGGMYSKYNPNVSVPQDDRQNQFPVLSKVQSQSEFRIYDNYNHAFQNNYRDSSSPNSTTNLARALVPNIVPSHFDKRIYSKNQRISSTEYSSPSSSPYKDKQSMYPYEPQTQTNFDLIPNQHGELKYFPASRTSPSANSALSGSAFFPLKDVEEKRRRELFESTYGSIPTSIVDFHSRISPRATGRETNQGIFQVRGRVRPPLATTSTSGVSTGNVRSFLEKNFAFKEAERTAKRNINNKLSSDLKIARTYDDLGSFLKEVNGNKKMKNKTIEDFEIEREREKMKVKERERVRSREKSLDQLQNYDMNKGLYKDVLKQKKRDISKRFGYFTELSIENEFEASVSALKEFLIKKREKGAKSSRDTSHSQILLTDDDTKRELEQKKLELRRKEGKTKYFHEPDTRSEHLKAHTPNKTLLARFTTLLQQSQKHSDSAYSKKSRTRSRTPTQLKSRTIALQKEKRIARSENKQRFKEQTPVDGYKTHYGFFSSREFDTAKDSDFHTQREREENLKQQSKSRAKPGRDDLRNMEREAYARDMNDSPSFSTNEVSRYQDKIASQFDHKKEANINQVNKQNQAKKGINIQTSYKPMDYDIESTALDMKSGRERENLKNIKSESTNPLLKLLATTNELLRDISPAHLPSQMSTDRLESKFDTIDTMNPLNKKESKNLEMQGKVDKYDEMKDSSAEMEMKTYQQTEADDKFSSVVDMQANKKMKPLTNFEIEERKDSRIDIKKQLFEFKSQNNEAEIESKAHRSQQMTRIQKLQERFDMLQNLNSHKLENEPQGHPQLNDQLNKSPELKNQDRFTKLNKLDGFENLNKYDTFESQKQDLFSKTTDAREFSRTADRTGPHIQTDLRFQQTISPSQSQSKNNYIYDDQTTFLNKQHQNINTRYDGNQTNQIHQQQMKVGNSDEMWSMSPNFEQSKEFSTKIPTLSTDENELSSYLKNKEYVSSNSF